MVKQVMIMSVLLKVVATSVRHDAPINDVDLADRPNIEARLREQFFEQGMLTYLDVTRSKAQSLHQCGIRKRALVIVMEDPCDRCRLAVDTRNLQNVERLEGDGSFLVDEKIVTMRT